MFSDEIPAQRLSSGSSTDQWRACWTPCTIRSSPSGCSVLFCRPPIAAELTELGADLFGHCLFTVDHYAHGELLNDAAMAPVDVLLRLKGTHSGFGIRPGAEAVRLWTGLSEIPHLRMAGLIVVTAFGDDGSAAVQAMMHTKRRLQECNFDPAAVLVSEEGMQSDQQQQTDQGRDAVDLVLWRPDRPPAVPSGTMTATVVSRPSLDTIVIGVPGFDAAVAATFPQYPDLRILGKDGDCLVVSPNGASERLTIGESILIDWS